MRCFLPLTVFEKFKVIIMNNKDFRNIREAKKILKEAELGIGGPKDVSRKVRTLERMREQILEYYGIISSFEFQKGFPKDSAEDIAEAAKLLEKASDLMA